MRRSTFPEKDRLPVVNATSFIAMLFTVMFMASTTLQGAAAIPGPDKTPGSATIKAVTHGEACPQIQLLTGLLQPLICVTQGPLATFDVYIPDLLNSGILAGTIWTLDWGDGTVNAPFTSAVDNQLPPLAWRQHTYTTVTTCNYVVSNGIRNPCGETRGVQYTAVVHGRDIPADGDGIIDIVNNADGSATIRVCEGIQSIITLRDNSTWNCQNPTVPTGLTAVPNNSTRNIEWVYGRTPAGALTNTITGLVAIATLGNAPQTSTRITPSPYGATSLSKAITIPATCKAGEYFRVHLKYWNKCNWLDPEYVFDYVDINVIAAPAAPTVGNTVFCVGSVPTRITATSTNGTGGTMKWYSNAALTTLLYTGASYTHGKTLAGTTTYYVTETLASGCVGPATTVTLIINAIPLKPTIAKTGADFCFNGTSSITLTATVGTPPAITSYQWYKGGTAVTGATTSTITLNTVAQSGTYTVRAFGIGPSFCPGILSNGTVVNIYDPPTATAGVDQTICSSSAVTLAGSIGGGAASSTWSTTGTGTFGNATALSTTYTPSAADITLGTVTLTLLTNDPTGPCLPATDFLVVTINPVATVSAGADQIVCATSPVVTLTGTMGGSAPSVIWTSNGTGTFASATSLNTTYTPSAADITAGTRTLTLTTGNPAGPCTPVNDAMTVTINAAPTVNAGAPVSVCGLTVVPIVGTIGGTAVSATWSTSGTGTFASPTSLSTTYTPSAADVAALSVTLTLTTNDPTGPCTAAISTKVINFNTSATADAGPDQWICNGATVTLAGAYGGTATSALWSGGTGTYNPGPGSMTAVYTPSAAERTAKTVTLTLTTNDPAGACTAATDQFVITIGSTPQSAAITGSGNVCYGPASSFSLSIVDGTPPYTVNYNLNGVAQPPIYGYVENTAYGLGVLPIGANKVLVTSIIDKCGNPVPPAQLPAVYTINVYDNPIANAGPDQQVCSVLAATLAGNAFPAATGVWTKISGPGTVTFSAASNPASTATVSAYGTYVYRWTLTIASCISFDEVSVTYSQLANAGPDQTICGTLSATLAANIIAPGTGSWAKVSGPGTVTFGDAANPASTVTVSAYGAYVLSWTSVNGACNSTDNMAISFAETANAGPDQTMCAVLAASMAANTPTVGAGAWTKVSGPGTVVFSGPTTPTSQATVSLYGTYTFRWTITNVTCLTSDDVVVSYARAANAGPDQQKCGVLTATLAGNTSEAGTGAWAKVSGPGSVTFANPASATSSVSVSLYGSYVFSWTITNGTCFTTDNVAVSFAETADPGPNQQKCGVLVATLAGNTPSVGTGAWAKVSGPGTVTFSSAASPSSTATVSAYGTYVYSWTITNVTCNTTANVTVAYAEAANAGPDQDICGILNVSLSGNTPSAGSGAWAQVSGPGTVTFTDPVNPVTTASASLYGTYILSWTITNGSCSTTNNMIVVFAEKANAGPDQQKCGILNASLAGNQPSAGTGAWAKVSGPGTVTFSNAASPFATVTVSAYGTYEVSWTITNGTCTTTDNVIVSFAETANAGPDQTKCGVLVATLAANSASAGAGAWAKVSGPGTVTFSNPSGPGSTATVSLYGTYVFSWTITNGSCSTTDNVQVSYAETANAGPDQYRCGILSATLAGNTASAGIGAWALVSGPGTVNFTNASGATSTVTVSDFGTYVFSWTITNGTCSTTDNVTIAFAETANAGPDQQKCGVLLATLAGNTPSAGAGEWTMVSGSGTVTFSDKTSPASTATVSAYGTYIFKWTITNGTCNTSDNVTISFAEAANAGPDQNLCSVLSATLAANSTSAGAGTWAKVSGPGTVTFTDVNDPLATATASLYGSYVFSWTITNGICSTTDQVTVALEREASAGPAQDLCNTFAGIMAGNTPAVGTGTWTLVSGPGSVVFSPGVNTPAATATVTVYGTYIYKWTIDNAGICSTSQDVIINYNPAGQVDQPGNQVFCNNFMTTAVTFNTTNTIGSTIFSWTNTEPGIGLAPAGTGDIASFRAVNNGSTTIVATIVVTPILVNGTANCAGTAKTFTITVNPTPVLNITNPVPLCEPASADITAPSVTSGSTPGLIFTYWTDGGATIPFTSQTAAPNGTYYIKGTTAAGCFTIKPVTVAIVPLPTTPPIAGALTNMCKGTNGQFYAVPYNAGNTYLWSISPSSPIVMGGGLSDPFIVLDFPSPGTYTLRVQEFTSTPQICGGPVRTLTITVNPTPAVNPMSAPVCSGNGFAVTPVNGVNGTVPVGTTYSWSAPTGSGFTGGIAGSGSSVTGALINTSNVAKTAVYSVTPTSGSCTGPNFNVTITINPKPVVTAMSATVCSQEAFTVTPVNGINGVIPSNTTYTWSAPAVTGSMTGGTGGSGPSLTATLGNHTNATQTAIYTVTPSSGGCTGADFTVVVTVNPKPSVTGMAASVCSGSPFSVSPANITNGIVPVGTTFTWAAPTVTGGLTGSAPGSGPAIAGTLVNPTNSIQSAIYIVTPSSGSCVGPDFTVTITVNPMPSVTNQNLTVCSATGFVLTPVNGTDGIIPSGIMYSWQAPAGSGFTGGTAGSASASVSGTLTNTTNQPQTAIYTVTPSTANCTGTPFTVTVTVNPRPAINVMSSTICSGGSFTATPANVTNGIVPAGTTYSWATPTITGGMTGGAAGSGTSVSATLTNPTNSVQTAIYSVTPSAGGCVGTDFTVMITVDPVPAVTPMTAVICSSGSFITSPSNGINGIVPPGTTYTWSAPSVTGGLTGGVAGSGASINGTLVNPTNAIQTATYSVTPSSSICTGIPFTITVTVGPKPAITPMAVSICSGETFTAAPANGTDGVVPAGTTYSWSAPVITGGITGAIAGSGEPAVSGTINNPTNSLQTATYTVTPLSGTCTGVPFTVVVTINPKPSVTPMTSVICSGGTFTETPVNVTNGTVPSGTTYTWTAPVVTGGLTGGSAGTGPSVTGTLVNPGNTVLTALYSVTPVNGACTGPVFTVTVTVNPVPAVTDMAATICSSGTFTVTPANGANGIVPAGTIFTWTAPVVTGSMTGGAAGSGGSVTGSLVNPTNTTQTAEYTVTPSSGSCTGATFKVIITVDPKPAVTAMTAIICSGGTFTLTPANGTNGIVPAGTNYTWVSPSVTGGMAGGMPGNNATEISGSLTNPTNSPQTATYIVLPAAGSCSGSTFTVTVTVNPLPVPTITGPASVCVASTGNVYSTEPGMTGYAWTIASGGTITAGGSASDNSVTVTWNTAGNHNVSVNYINANGCTALTPTVKTISVNPLPVPVIIGNAAVCFNSAGNVYSTEAGMTNYIWSVSAGGTVTAGGTTGDNTITITWNTVGAQTVSVNYTNLNGCTAVAPTVYNVIVNPLPVPVITGPASACVASGGNVYSTETGMTNYIWNVSAGGVITDGGTGNETVTVTWTSVGTRTVSVRYTNASGCTAASPTIYSVTVNPLPIVSLTGPGAVCVTSTGNVYTTDPGMTNYSWTVSPGGTISSGGAPGDNTATITWNATGPQSVSVNYSNANGCRAASPTVRNVTVNPLPVPSLAGNASACVNSIGNVYTTDPGMMGYVWTVSAGGTIQSGGDAFSNTVTVTWITAGAQTVTVNYTNSNGCTASSATVKDVTVNPLPVPVITGPAAACIGSTGNIYKTEAGMTNYIWSVSAGGVITSAVNETVTVTWIATGPRTVSVNYTNGNGCTATVPTVYNVTINPLPVPVITGPAAACVTSTGNVYSTDAGMTSYIWTVSAGGMITSGGGTTDNTATVTWTTSGSRSISVSYTNGNGCTASTPVVYPVTVNPLPVPQITGPLSVCETTTGHVYTTDAAMTGYTWVVSSGGTITAGGTSTHNTVTVTWNTAGAQSVSVNYTNGNGCTAPAPTVYPVTVNPLPVPVISGNTAACQNSSGNIYTTEPGMSNYIWTVSAGGTVTAGGTTANNTILITWNTPGPQTVSVRYTNGNGCVAAAATVYNVTVNSLPVPTVSGPASACVTSTGNVYTTEAAMTSYIWIVSAGGTITSGGGLNDNTVTVTWVMAGAQSVGVRYTDANGCTAAVATVKPVTVNPLPVISLTGPGAACVTSTGNVFTTETGMTNYTWTVSAGGTISSGGSSSDNTATITWNTSGPQNVSVNYSNANGCRAASPTVRNVTVNPLPVPAIGGNPSVCVNSTGNVYTTDFGMTAYVWTVSAGGTITAGGDALSNTVTVTWLTAGPQTVTVNYSNSNGCTASSPSVKDVTVNPLPVPVISGPAAACIGSSGNIYTTESGMTNYIWSVSAGGVITSSVNEILTVTWTATGPRTVSVNYTNGNGCTATVPTVYNVTINPLPVPVITGPAAACVTSSGNVYSTQTGMTNYVWAISAGGTITSGGGSTDNTATVTWTITGSRSISVSYTNGNGCTALTPVVYPVTVNPLPVPQILGPQAACATTTGHIYTTDAGMTGYTWSVSSGGTITAGGSAADNSVTVTWNTAGPQSISVNYTNGNGCTAAAPTVYPVTVNPLPVPVITGNTAACQNSTGNIYTTEPGMSNYIWTVSAGGTVTAGGTTANNTILITWNTPGPQAVSVAYTNGNGCIAAAATVYPVTVNPLPVPAISGPASACVTSTGNVYTTEPGMTNYIWVLSTGGTIASGGGLGDNTITVTWVLTGAQSVGVRYTDANGCTAAVATVKPVTVNPLPVPALLGSAGECVGSSGNVYTTDAGMTGYVWAVSAGGTITSAGGSGDNTAVITWNTAGPQNVSVSYTNSNGCTAGTPTVKPVTVHLLPVPTITGPVSVCETTAGNVYTTEVGMANYVWNVSAGGTVTAGGTGTNTVTVTWNTAGAQTVTVNYTNANSCAGATPAVKDVAVHALPVPVITGPAASCVGSVGNVYSTEAGMTAYVWAVSSGGVITAVGAGNETVTVTWTTVGPHTVSVNYTNTNGCTAAAPTVYNVTANPLPVPSLTGPASVCASSTGNVYTTETGMSGYSWTVSPGGSITAGGTSTDNTVTVTWNASGPATVRVNYINGNGCTAVNPTIYPVTVNPLPVPVITGPAAICDESSGVYTTETGMTLYTWVVSSGGTITSGGGASDNSVTVLWATPGPQSVSVNYSNSNGCRAAAPTVYSVTVNPLPVPVIAGPSSACFNSTGNLYTTEGGMTNYIWTVSAGGTVTSGGTTASNTVTVTWNTSGPQTVSVIYTNGNGCTSSPATVYNVTVNALPVPVINGPDPVCALSGGNVYTTEAGMSGYIWLISGGGTITSGGGTGDNTITVRWNIPGSQTVSVNYTDLNGCRAATATVKTLTVNPLPVPVITGVTPVCQNASGNVYSTQTGMTNYIWAVSPGGTITSGGGTGDNTATITWNTTGINSISVIYTDANGCTSAPASVFSVTVNPHPVPTITGPVAVCVGTIGSLYFTEPGMTNYTWVVSAGGTITAGGGLGDNTATITWNTAGPQSVSVNYTNLNGCEGVTPTSRSVSVNPLPVPLITGPALACEKSAGNIYLTEPGMANYVWTVSSGGTITAGGTSGNNSVTVYWQTTGAQSVSVSYTNGNGCTALAATVYDVTVNIPPIPVITGPATVCVSSEGNVYSTEAGMTNYIWTVSPGGIITAGGSGTESVTVTWTTQGARSVSVNYTGASGCSALTPTVYPVTVNTRPVVTISGPTSLCLNTSGVVYTTEPGYTGYTWAVSSGGTITSGGGSNDNTVTIWWNRAGAQSISVNFTDGNGCPAFTPTIYPVIVNPLPVPIIKGNASVCKNSVGNIYTTEPGMSNYTWTVSAGGIISAGGGLNNNTIIITWSETGPQNVSVLYTNGNGCFPAAATVYDVYVNALPVPVINGPSVVCAATAGNVYTTEAGMTSYIWSISAGGTITAGGGSGDNTVSITWNSAGSRSVSVNYTDTHGCRAEISTVYDILVNQLPIGILSGGETICPGESSVITVNIPVGAPPFTIDIENYPGSTIANYVSGTELTVTPAGTTTYRLVRIRDANGCEVIGSSPNMSGTATIIVRDLPSITSFSPPGPVCEFAPATFRVTVAGDNVEYQWYVDEGTGFTALTDNGSYIGVTMPTMQVVNTVRTLSGNKYHVVITGCNAQVTSPDGLLIINTAPEITVHPSDSTICLGAGAVMKADATGTGVTWQWYVNKGLGFVAVADDANFSGSATKTLTITDALASFNSWVFRAKATGTCGVPVFSNFARLMVIKPPVVTVQPVPRAICEGGYTSFLANGTGYLSVQWQVLNGATWTNISDDVVYSGTNSGQLAVFNPPVSLTGKQFRLALQGVCAAVYSNAVTLTVNANPVVNFPAPLDACGGVPLVINGNPQGGSGIYSTHRWTGDAGPLSNTAIQSPTFTAQITGDYYLNYSVVDNKGCSANGDLIIKVDSPSADFFRDISNGCDPLTVSFTKDMTGISKFWWDFDDGSPLDSLNANPVHVFANKNATTIGYYNVKLKVRSPAGCFDTYTSMITVYPKSDATFTASKLVVCSGNTVDFTALSGASKYYWEFGDGAAGYSANNATHLFLNLGRDPVVNEVKLTTQSFYNCPDVKTLKITVMPVPVAQFTAVPPTQVFNDAGNSVTFNNETNPGTWLFSWNFGDNKTSTEESPVHLYKTAGEITVSLLVKNTACADSIKHKIYITPPAPVANFDSIPPGCEPLSATFHNTSVNADLPGTVFHWDFGDGGVSSLKNPTYTYFESGMYRIKLTVTSPGGTSTKAHFISVYTSPKAYFDIAPKKVFVNDEKVRCFNLSEDATSFKWEFGDGDTTTVAEPLHQYRKSGTFDITLWAYSENGCSDKYVMSPGVTVEPPGKVVFPTVFTPNKDGPIDIYGLPTGGIEIDQFFFPPIREKIKDFKMQIFNRLGVLIFESHDIDVPWNGYYHNKLCQQGVYVWYVEGKYEDGQPFKMVGDITLLH